MLGRDLFVDIERELAEQYQLEEMETEQHEFGVVTNQEEQLQATFLAGFPMLGERR